MFLNVMSTFNVQFSGFYCVKRMLSGSQIFVFKTILIKKTLAVNLYGDLSLIQLSQLHLSFLKNVIIYAHINLDKTYKYYDICRLTFMQM